MLQVWSEIGGKEFFAHQACVNKIRHAIGEAGQLLPDMVNLGPAFTEIYSQSEACNFWCRAHVSRLLLCSPELQMLIVLAG